ncbi:hypothetical protein ABK040_013934 [Willaertia magna]
MCYNNIGWCYKHLNNEEKACEYYSKAIEVSGGNVVLFYTNRIKSLKALNKYKEAIDNCLGFLHHLKGDRELACCTFMKAIDNYKAFFFPYLYLGAVNLSKTIHYRNRNNNQSLPMNKEKGIMDSVDIITEGIGNCSEGLSDLFQMRSNVYDALNDSLNKDADIVKTLQIKRGLFERMG